MQYSEIVSITGMPGLFRINAQKGGGLIVTSLTEGWTKFVSSREHMFTPLENISIYTHADTVELLDVFITALDQKENNPPVDEKSDNNTLKAYFEKLLPDYDREKVHVSDMKKFVKWFAILDAQGILASAMEERKAGEKENATPEEEKE
ncbi:MAG: DUF5606 domain-containing protein [Chitinophagales bacterium]